MKKASSLYKNLQNLRIFFTLINFVILFIILSSFAALVFFFLQEKQQTALLAAKLKSVNIEFTALKNQDQYKINQDLKKRVDLTENSYKDTAKTYEKILDLKAQKQNTDDLDKSFIQILNDLSTLNYTSASAKLTVLKSDIDKQYSSIASTQTAGPSVSANVSNAPPGSGYSYQSVQTDSGIFNVAIIAADLNSTRVIIDTASDHDCSNDCPVLPLGTYAARSGAFAAINGSFFCPAEYPSCAGKTNSFDTLLMNKNKVYFNSDNNKYSTIPLAYFSGNSMGVRSQTLNWGRDTGVDGVIANHPLYIEGGNDVFGGSGEEKLNNKGTRTFVAHKGSTVYIGIIYNASSSDAGKVLKVLGVDDALGLDQGGSTALWMNGSYLAGPGRNIPNALLFVRK